jgi:hypothetical protein
MEENDRDLRFQLAELMAERTSPQKAALVLKVNPRAHPTAKMGVGKVHDLAFSPFGTVFRDVECGDLAERNQETAAALATDIRQRGREVRAATGSVRGWLMGNVPALHVADILESFQFSAHNPESDSNPLRGYYRLPEAGRPIGSRRHVLDDPYELAAYLRFWCACLADGVDPVPLFNVGVAVGEISAGSAPYGFALMNREITADGRLAGGWTGPSPNWPGDAFFDFPAPPQVVDGSNHRRAGAPGLLLLYVVHKDARGRAGRGLVRSFHTPTVGVIVPAGGPEIRRVTVTQELLGARS